MRSLIEASRMLRAAYLEIVKAALKEDATDYLTDAPQNNEDEEATSEEEIDDTCAH